MQIDISTVSPEIKSWLYRVQQGEPIFFTEQGKIIGKLTSSKNLNKSKRQAGLLSGISLDPAFFDPLEAEDLKLWQGDK